MSRDKPTYTYPHNPPPDTWKFYRMGQRSDQGGIALEVHRFLWSHKVNYIVCDTAGYVGIAVEPGNDVAMVEFMLKFS